MNKNNSSRGFTIQIVNIKDSNVNADKSNSDIFENKTQSKEKEHASKNKSGQPPSDKNKSSKTKTFSTRLVLLLILVIIILLLILACCILTENQFDKLIDFLVELFTNSMLYAIFV